MIFLLFALLDGIFRLMADNGLSTGILKNIYLLHPILMVFGFLASIVMAERVAGISVIPQLNKSSLPLTMVPLILIGTVFEIIGYTAGIALAKFAGGAFLLAGSVVFILLLANLAQNIGAKLPFYFMMTSGVSLAASAMISAFFLPLENFGFIMLLLCFPLMFILGERIELTRFTSSVSANQRFKIAFGFSCAAVIAFAVSSIPEFSIVQAISSSLGSVLLLGTIVIVLLGETQNWKLLLKSSQPLQKYVVSHTRVAYTWGILGVILAAIYTEDSMRLDLYDPFIHSIAVGFIGTMLLAHGPVILPTVTGRKIDVTKISILPLAVLTMGNLIRIVGDLIFLSYVSRMLEIFVGLSGWLILIAVILFMHQIFTSSVATKAPAAKISHVSST